MKAISLWQPWASLYLTPAKIHETRGWEMRYRGPLLIHAAKHPVHLAGASRTVWDICRTQFGEQWMKDMPLGAIVGKVDIIACIPTTQLYPPGGELPMGHRDDYECGNFSEGRWAHQTRGRAFRCLKRPSHSRGNK
jgi:hypothetical protein